MGLFDKLKAIHDEAVNLAAPLGDVIINTAVNLTGGTGTQGTGADMIPSSKDWDFGVDKVGDIMATPIAVLTDAAIGEGSAQAGALNQVGSVVEVATDETAKAVNKLIDELGKATRNVAGEAGATSMEAIKPVLIIGGLALLAAVVIGTSKTTVAKGGYKIGV